ncbi:mechanosensitive ion channel family protein [Alicyclobacillus mengziensis]|uniref:Mechanosensitive ion channel family protein n=1 Tax=Alicyclobacillus mengziensis TaxID=2931921 RepID=A0A9X7Z8C8_9BACL|nr:mechanosensitive ion channel family protein [Alicyclobacillus mengziensis]QSO48275.1 mechanosensitive ion channel family protein [Alicyclobacillus mengziensis]
MDKKRKSQITAIKLWRTTLVWSFGLVILGVALLVWVDTHVGVAKYIPPKWTDIFKALIILVIGSIVSTLIERRLFGLASVKLGPQRSTTLRYITRLLLFITIAISVMTAFGVGIPSVLFGGTFLTVIIGLAGQTIFSNIIGGVWLIMFRPFRIGDSIGIIAWQFPVLMPSFPHEATRPMYYGKVLDINLMYTQILNQDGYPQLIPNGIIAQSFIENRSETGLHRTRLRFDVSYDVDADTFTRQLREQLEHEFPGDETFLPEVRLADVYPTAYSVAVSVYSLEKEDLVRDQVFRICIDIMQRLRASSLLDS